MIEGQKIDTCGGHDMIYLVRWFFVKVGWTSHVFENKIIVHHIKIMCFCVCTWSVLLVVILFRCALHSIATCQHLYMIKYD